MQRGVRGRAAEDEGVWTCLSHATAVAEEEEEMAVKYSREWKMGQSVVDDGTIWWGAKDRRAHEQYLAQLGKLTSVV
jgi:hypothetical protein